MWDRECYVWKSGFKIRQLQGGKKGVQSWRLGSVSLTAELRERKWGRGRYMWPPCLWEGGGGGGGGGSSSSSLCCVAGVSASMKESVERVLARSGARWRRLLGSLTWALWDGATMLPSSSASASHGGMCSPESSSGMKAGFSIPAE